MAKTLSGAVEGCREMLIQCDAPLQSCNTSNYLPALGSRTRGKRHYCAFRQSSAAKE